MDLVRERGIETLSMMGSLDDARIQRDVARAMACLSVTEDIKGLMVSKGALPTIFKLSRVRACALSFQ
jgi:hypothetical protein